MAEKEGAGWLDDFSLVVTPDTVRGMRRDPGFEAFTGSKAAAFPWLVLVSVLAGALGGLAVSGILWSRWWQVPLWLACTIAFWAVVLRAVRRAFQQPLPFLAGWGMFFGMLIGALTMWAAQVTSPGWCYGIAGGLVFFLLGITGGLIEPPNSKRMEDWFLTSAAAAPAGSCLAAWIYRNLLTGTDGLAAAALTGALAALPFLAVTLGLHLYAWKPERGLVRLALLYLHEEGSVAKAIGLLDGALKANPASAALLARRGLAHALTGNIASAEEDWARARTIEPGTTAAEIARGWAALRRGDSAGAAAAFEGALALDRRDPTALTGLGVARLREGDAAAALAVLKRVPGKKHGALSLTYLAEAHLRTGDAPSALSTATAAIEETDSIHGRSWIVRAEAQRALGRIDAAAEDYNRALLAADEVGIESAALAGLEEIDRPVSEDEPDW
ncbi:MAG TPA: tetratricopeptide repeat protein [Allosphingosinicella sp.]